MRRWPGLDFSPVSPSGCAFSSSGAASCLRRPLRRPRRDRSLSPRSRLAPAPRQRRSPARRRHPRRPTGRPTTATAREPGSRAASRPCAAAWSRPGRRGLRRAARGRRPGGRGHRGRQRVRPRPRQRARRMATPPRDAGAALFTPVRQHRPARDHEHAGLRSDKRIALRGGGDLVTAPPALRLGCVDRRGALVAQR